MSIALIKLHFTTAVYFGTTNPFKGQNSFFADTLFSALFIEALKNKSEAKLLQLCKDGALIFSDSLPFICDKFFVPKPMLKIASQGELDPSERKKYKKLKFIEINELDNYLKGKVNFEANDTSALGKFATTTKLNLSTDNGVYEAVALYKELFKFKAGSGLYLVVKYQNKVDFDYFISLLNSLSFIGIGGLKFSGLGKFNIEIIDKGSSVNKFSSLLDLDKVNSHDTNAINMLLSTAYPKDEELSKAIEGSTYLLVKRSGFIQPSNNEISKKKKDRYYFAQGSCFKEKFAGDIFDIANNMTRPSYSYAKPLFLRLHIC